MQHCRISGWGMKPIELYVSSNSEILVRKITSYYRDCTRLRGRHSPPQRSRSDFPSSCCVPTNRTTASYVWGACERAKARGASRALRGTSSTMSASPNGLRARRRAVLRTARTFEAADDGTRLERSQAAGGRAQRVYTCNFFGAGLDSCSAAAHDAVYGDWHGTRECTSVDYASISCHVRTLLPTYSCMSKLPRLSHQL